MRDEFTVTRRNSETFEVFSYLTRGRCATVYMFDFAKGRKSIVPFLIPAYMQGITNEMISKAVDDFLEKDKASQAS